MTQGQALHLSLFDKDYFAKPVRRRSQEWGVWSRASDHWVEFDPDTVAKAGKVDPATNEYLPLD